MTVIVRFCTRLFDVSSERVNPINPIAGESLLLWLKARLEPVCDVTEPDAEDWGWFCHLDWRGSRYLLGSSASEAGDGEHEWVLQIVPTRTWKQRLLGRRKIDPSDLCVKHIVGLLAAESAFHGIQVEGTP